MMFTAARRCKQLNIDNQARQSLTDTAGRNATNECHLPLSTVSPNIRYFLASIICPLHHIRCVTTDGLHVFPRLQIVAPSPPTSVDSSTTAHPQFSEQIAIRHLLVARIATLRILLSRRLRHTRVINTTPQRFLSRLSIVVDADTDVVLRATQSRCTPLTRYLPRSA
jgi:hypothetical protein